MPRPSNPPRLDYSNYTWRRVQIFDNDLIFKLTKSIFEVLRPQARAKRLLYPHPNMSLAITVLQKIKSKKKSEKQSKAIPVTGRGGL
jgi:hypothetical protein